MAEPRALLPWPALRRAFETIVCRHLTIARVAEAPAVSWNTANDAVPAEGRPVLISDSHRLDTASAAYCGPTEAINGRLEHLRGSAPGFRKPRQRHRKIT